MNNRKNKFFKYLIPSVIGMLVSALYVVVDGIFVGRGIGADALASINIAVPYTTLLLAVSSGIGIGGSALLSISYGKDKKTEGITYFNSSIFLLFISIFIISFLGVFFSKEIVTLLGSSTELLEMSSTYLKYYSMFSIFFSLALSLSSFVRNDGNPNLTMYALITGAITNIILDYIFIFELNMGVKGAAIASGLGQLLSVLILLLHFISKKKSLKIDLSLWKIKYFIPIIKAGLPEFIVQTSNAITILAFNVVSLKLLGETGVAAYSIISYVGTILLALFIGVSQGSQPLISYSFGNDNKDDLFYYLKLALKTNLILSILIYIVVLLFGQEIAGIFNTDANLINITYKAMQIYFFSYIFASINIIAISFNQGINNYKFAAIVSILRGVVLIVLYLSIIPALFGPTGIWSSIVLAEFTTLIILAIYYKYIKGLSNIRL